MRDRGRSRNRQRRRPAQHSLIAFLPLESMREPLKCSKVARRLFRHIRAYRTLEEQDFRQVAKFIADNYSPRDDNGPAVYIFQFANNHPELNAHQTDLFQELTVLFFEMTGGCIPDMRIIELEMNESNNSQEIERHYLKFIEGFLEAFANTVFAPDLDPNSA